MTDTDGASELRSGAPLDPWAFEDLARGRLADLAEDADPDAMSLVFRLVRVASELLGELETSVHRRRGWSWAGFRIMFWVAIAGPLEPRQVAPLAGVTRASISAVLNTLERDGLVERRRASDDRRVVTIVLTDAGRRAVAEGFAVQHEVERLWASTLTASERRSLGRILRKLIDARPAIDTVENGEPAPDEGGR